MDFWPRPGRPNATLRFAVYMGVALYAVKGEPKYMFIPTWVMLYQWMTRRRDAAADGFAPLLQPSVDDNNPMDNPLPFDEPRDPDSKPDYDSVRHQRNAAAAAGIFRDVGDVYAEQANSRAYYSVPAGTVPNDQMAFAKALFGEVGTFRAGIGCDGTLALH